MPGSADILLHRRRRSAAVRAGTRGTAGVEFAFFGLVFVGFLFAFFEFGRVLWTLSSLQYAVQQTARCIAINAAPCDNAADSAAYAASQVLGVTVPATDFAISTTACGNSVVANVPFVFMVSAIVPSSITLSVQSCFPT